MQQYLSLLAQTALFVGIPAAQLPDLLLRLRPTTRQYQKGALLLMAGYETRDIGVVLAGQAKGIKTTPDGTDVALIGLDAGSIFGDILAGSAHKSPVTITALTPCRVLLIPSANLFSVAVQGHPHYTHLMRNLVCVLSQKYFALSDRLDLLILKSLRGKLCSFLLQQSALQQSDTFTVPYSRTALAEHLNCERSALSREISRMQAEGMIETYKSSFRLLDKPAMRRHSETGRSPRP